MHFDPPSLYLGGKRNTLVHVLRRYCTLKISYSLIDFFLECFDGRIHDAKIAMTVSCLEKLQGDRGGGLQT